MTQADIIITVTSSVGGRDGHHQERKQISHLCWLDREAPLPPAYENLPVRTRNMMTTVGEWVMRNYLSNVMHLIKWVAMV